MLSLGKIAAGPQAASYYTVQVAQGRDDYYAGAGEEPGRWVGAGAQRFGWVGEVDAEQFASLLGGAGLRKPPREGAVAGFDLTFSAPKSVSLLWAVGRPHAATALRAGHDAAVADALGYLEREACRARRGRGGAVQVRGDGFVGAAFMHRTSRAGDPQLHTHVVIGNLTRGPDGRWTALDARHLYRQAKTAGYLYQAVLRRELTERLGLEWKPVQRGVADLAVVPREVIEHFSQRRAEILEHMAEHGGRSAASAEIAALETRRGKQHVPLARQHELWQSRAAEHGLTRRSLDRALRHVAQALPLPSPLDPHVLTEHDSAFGRADVLRALAEAQPYGATVADLEQLADATLADRDIVPLRDGIASAGLSEARFTTREMLAIERRLIDGASSRRGSGTSATSEEAVRHACSGRPLSDEQHEMVRRLCTERDGVAVVRAAAGTGKTFALDAAREAWNTEGIHVCGCALSARAALELSDQAAIESVTIKRLTRRLDRGYELPHRSVLVVDEAGMVGTRDLGKLADAAERAETKLVLVGDDRQLPEIHAGGAFRKLADELHAIELREVRRQRTAWDRDALRELRDGEVERWARAYRDHGRITVASSAELARAALVNDWALASDRDRVMIAARREDVRDLNERARGLCQSRGDVARDELTIGGRSFASGDRVIGTRNDRHLGILNGQRGHVTAIDRDRESLDVRLDNGQQIEVGASYLQPGHLDHGYAITAHRAQGMTVEQSFVLGSQDLYRELGYTALSRHRDEARFYVARSDLDVDRREIPPDRDPIVSSVTRLLERSEHKDLAIESLPHADVEQLTAERAGLLDRLEADLPSPRHEHIERQEIARHQESLDEAHDRERRIREHKDRARWWELRERQQLESLARRAREDQERQQGALDRAAAEREARDRAEDSWLGAHRGEIERLVSVEQELSIRGAIDREVTDRLAALDREPARRELDQLDVETPELTDADLDPYPRHKPRPPDAWRRIDEILVDRPRIEPPDYFDLGP